MLNAAAIRISVPNRVRGIGFFSDFLRNGFSFSNEDGHDRILFIMNIGNKRKKIFIDLNKYGRSIDYIHLDSKLYYKLPEDLISVGMDATIQVEGNKYKKQDIILISSKIETFIYKKHEYKKPKFIIFREVESDTQTNY